MAGSNSFTFLFWKKTPVLGDKKVTDVTSTGTQHALLKMCVYFEATAQEHSTNLSII